LRGARILRLNDQWLCLVMSATRRRSAIISALLAIASIGLAGCVGSGSSTPSAAPNPPLHLYRARLSGRAEIPAGAPKGSGWAIIAIHSGSVVCWRFAHLHGFSDAAAAQIQVGLEGRAGVTLLPLSTGPRLHHRGCVQANTAAIKAIERAPSGYYVSVHSQGYPTGAVRGQL
jgi:hypothetical protein